MKTGPTTLAPQTRKTLKAWENLVSLVIQGTLNFSVIDTWEPLISATNAIHWYVLSNFVFDLTKTKWLLDSCKPWDCDFQGHFEFSDQVMFCTVSILIGLRAHQFSAKSQTKTYSSTPYGPFSGVMPFIQLLVAFVTIFTSLLHQSFKKASFISFIH